MAGLDAEHGESAMNEQSPTPSYRRSALINVGISIAAVVVALLAIEGGLRLARAISTSNSGKVALHVLCDDCPYLYELNPDHPEISSQGFRDKEYPFSKTRGALRILMLGDSVTFGTFVPTGSTFTSRLEDRLNERFGNVEVINAGVSGYTPYNELHYYRSKLSSLRADVVVVAFVMNDVVDPYLHWNYTKEAIPNIQIEAVPNLEYHNDHVLPQLESMRSPSLLDRSPQYDLIRSRLTAVTIDLNENSYDYVSGQRWPTYITGEDTVSIKVLLDYDSPEWEWLRSTYDQLNTAVTDDGATLVILVLPLAYQLDEAYPYLPQVQLARYCRESSIPCLDVLTAFREHAGEKLFLGRDFGFNDIWHLTERGHQLVAEELEVFILEQGLLE